jgi:hypothetical protein
MTIRVQLTYLNTKGVTTLLLNILHNSKSSRLALLGGLLLLHNTKTLRTTLLEGPPSLHHPPRQQELKASTARGTNSFESTFFINIDGSK